MAMYAKQRMRWSVRQLDAGQLSCLLPAAALRTYPVNPLDPELKENDWVKLDPVFGVLEHERRASRPAIWRGVFAIGRKWSVKYTRVNLNEIG